MISSSKQCMFHIFLIHFLLLPLPLINNTNVTNIVTSLPGYPGNLPFKLETGYISAGENDEVQLFYYFIESESDPRSDPLVLWLTGGPGCSGFSGLVYEIGPLTFNLSSSDERLRFPSLVLNPYSWTKAASLIFIDSPVGTGFSYATTSEGYASSDTKATKDAYTFLKKWLLNHPTFMKNHMYIAGDSYGGISVPLLASEIVKGNEDGLGPRMALQGYIIGNARPDARKYDYEKILFAHRLALISDEIFELAKSSCQGEYVNPDPSNYQCLYAIRLITDCTDLINEEHILEPKCVPLEPMKSSSRYVSLQDASLEKEKTWCRSDNYKGSYVWANDETTQEALHVRKGLVPEWVRCNKSLSFEHDVQSVFKQHQILSNKGYRVLAYSGDHDMVVPYTSTLKWIRDLNLNLTIDEAWRPWTVDGQVAGYTESYKNNHTYITFATVKDAGHTAPEYKPKECLAMVSRWLSLSSL